MKIQNVYELLDRYAPFELSDRMCKEEGCYDNSGLIVGTDDDVKGVLFSLDLTELAVERAREQGCNVIVTHHPAIYHPIKSVGGALKLAVAYGIGVISCHLNLDCAEHGIDYWFARGLGADKQEILTPLSDKEGYGRRFFLGKSLVSIRRAAEETFNTTVLCYGCDDMHINTVASFCGSGLGEKEADAECDLLCSADVPHHVILKAVSQGKAVMVFTHYSCENYGLMKLYEHFCESEALGENIKTYFFDDKRFF